MTVQVTTFRVAHRVLWQYAHDLGPPPLPLVDGTLPLKKTAGDDPSKAARLVGPPVHIITTAQVKM